MLSEKEQIQTITLNANAHRRGLQSSYGTLALPELLSAKGF